MIVIATSWYIVSIFLRHQIVLVSQHVYIFPVGERAVVARVFMEFTQGILCEFIHLQEANKCALILVFFRVASLRGWLDSMMETHGGASFCQENNFNSSTFNTL